RPGQRQSVTSLGAGRHRAEYVTVSADGRRALTAGDPDNSVVLWDLSSGAEVRRLTGHQTVPVRLQFSPDGRLALSAERGGWEQLLTPGRTGVRLWEVDS